MLFDEDRGQSDRLSYQVYGPETGIAHLAIDSIVEDQDGAIWVSADDGGLYRFDGRNFEVQLSD